MDKIRIILLYVIFKNGENFFIISNTIIIILAVTLYAIQAHLVGKGLSSPQCISFPSVIFNPVVYKYSFWPCLIVAWNKLPVTTDIFAFANGIMSTIKFYD